MKRRSRMTFICVMLAALMLMLSACRTSAPEETPAAQRLSGNLTCVEISRFSGGFVEDGTDEQVTDVAAILVANNTGNYLELATVTYQVGDRTAEFQVTGLPSGERVWVLEKNRMRISEGDELVFEDCQVTYNPNVICETKELSVVRQGNSLTVTNTTGKTLKNVCVYYKNRLEDGTFMGGITYLMTFDDLAPGASAQRSTAHFGENSEIVRFSYQAE